MSTTKSSSSSSSSDSSSSNTPETPKKLLETSEKTPIGSPDSHEVPKSSLSSPETSNVPKLPPSSPESSKVSESPLGSPETPKVPTPKVSKSPSSPENTKASKSPSSSENSKVSKSQQSSPETAKVPRSLPSSPETAKVPKSLPSSPGTAKVPKSPPSYPETAKVPKSPPSSPETAKVPKSPPSSPETIKVPKSPSFPETAKVSKSPQSSSESSKAPKSPSSSPESFKVSKSPLSFPESFKVPKSPQSSPETAKVPKSPPSSPETVKILKSLSSSPEPCKVPKSPPSSPESSKAPKFPSSPQSSKVSKSPSFQETPKFLKSPLSSPETSNVPKYKSTSPEGSKVHKSPVSSSEDSKIPNYQLSSPDATQFAKLSTRFQEVPDSPKFPSQPSNIPKKVLRHDFIHKVPSTESPENTKCPSPSEPRVPPKKLLTNKTFTSTLKVFLEKEDRELMKSKEYKEKVKIEKTPEEGAVDEEWKCSVDGGIDTEKDEVRKEEVKEKVNTKNIDIEAIRKKIKSPILPKFKKREELKGKEKNKEEEEENRMEIDNEVNQDKEKSEECEDVVKDEKKDKENKVMEDETANEKKNKMIEMEEEKQEKVTEEEKEQSEEIVTEEGNKNKIQEKKVDKTEDDQKDKEEKEKKVEEKTSEVTKEENLPMEEAKEKETKKETKKKKKEGKESIKREEDIDDEKAQGLLYLKRKRPFNRWKEYFFVLDGMLLTYYRSQHDYEHLASMKGSLDLSLLEDVFPKKPGIMRMHHPFCLSRRNLPFIVLAAETKEEQERWIQVLLTVVGPRRQSCHSLEKTVKQSSISPRTKYSTLPTRIKETETGSCSSSITEEEEGVAQRNDEEEEEEENEELVKPKKVMRVPIGMPLVKVDLNQVKLKKVERKEEERENVEDGKATDSPSNITRERPLQVSEEEERLPAEVFGVMLKRTKTKEECEEKESSRERSPRDGSPRLNTSSSGSIKRSLKQPVIPLNSSKLLVVPEGKDGHSPPRLSPATQKRASSERKKSPSPSLPISKSVQALTKSAEEVKSTQADVKTSPDSANNTGKRKVDAEVKVFHAQTNEVDYSDNVDVLLMEEVTKNVLKIEVSEEENKEETQEEGSKGEIQDKMKGAAETENEAINKNEEEDTDEENVSESLVETSVKVKEKEENREDNKDKDEENKEMAGALKQETSDDPSNKNINETQQLKDSTSTKEHNHLRSKEDKGCVEIIESSCVASTTTPITPPASPTSSLASSQSKSHKASISSRSCDSVPSSPKGGYLVREKTPSPTIGIRQRSATLQEKPEFHKEGEESDVVLRYSPRDRSNTNESACSSFSEGSERKSSKFKLFKNKLKVSGSVKEKKQDSGLQKEPKEKKRKGSNAFSILLHGKKAKEVNVKTPEQESQTSQQDDLNWSPPAPRDEITLPAESLITEMKPSLEHVLPPEEEEVKQTPVEVCLTPPPIHLSCEEEPDYPVPPTMTSCGSEDNGDVTFRTTTTKISESNPRTYSYTSTSSCEDPPPSIPEKTHRRASSPNHDVPKNNRPVTNIHLLFPENYAEEEEENKRVDGYISEKQIEELLIAKENREKRKRSLSRGQVFAKPDLIKGTLSASASEEWSTKRPSYTSFSSIESDEPLPTTNFLSFEQQSSSSGSFKGVSRAEESERSSFYSDDGESINQEGEGIPESVPVRRAPRPTDAIAANIRVSLTSPEFTVMEEEAHNSPETPKATIPPQISVEEKETAKECHSDDEDN